MTTEAPAQAATKETTDTADTQVVEVEGQETGEAQSVDALPEWAQLIVKEARTTAARYRAEKKEAEKAAQDATDAELLKKQEFETLYNNEKEARLKADKAKNKAEVALRFPELPAQFVERLQGETIEELEADAQSLIDAMQPGKPKAPNLNGGAGSKQRPSEKATQATPEEIAQAKKMGINIDDYLKNK